MDGNFDGWIPVNEAWTYASADSPTFTFTVSGDLTNKYSPGMRIKLTQSSVAYFIITAVSYSSPNTTVTVYGGIDYTLANADITFPYYSTVKAPFGFPLDPAKWTVETVYSTNGNQSGPSANNWYNVGSVSIDVPIGAWRLTYATTFGFDSGTTSQDNNAYVTLSTSNNGQSDAKMTAGLGINNSTIAVVEGTREEFIKIASKTTYYMNVMSTVSGLDFLYMGGGTLVQATIQAICSYL
jgi:hypothetical protein